MTNGIEAGETLNGSAREERGLREPDSFEQRRLLTEAMARLSHATSIDELVNVLRECARTIARCDGVTVIRREGDRVAYVAEDAMTPLWAGERFPIENCISGLAILEARPIHIPDIYDDPRVPVAQNVNCLFGGLSSPSALMRLEHPASSLSHIFALIKNK